jgi:hypothetical protein
MRKHFQTLIIVIVTVLGTMTCVETLKPKVEKPESGFDTGFGCETEDITNMYEDYIEGWKKEISSSFDKAEKEIFKDNVTPDVVGPHPDPKKCICGGSGVIVQGDGHKTPCPYHGSKVQRIEHKMHGMKQDIIVKPLIILEE